MYRDQQDHYIYHSEYTLYDFDLFDLDMFLRITLKSMNKHKKKNKKKIL
jgi:hypothetical protein